VPSPSERHIGPATPCCDRSVEAQHSIRLDARIELGADRYPASTAGERLHNKPSTVVELPSAHISLRPRRLTRVRPRKLGHVGTPCSSIQAATARALAR
jgi:hypothetical protein